MGIRSKNNVIKNMSRLNNTLYHIRWDWEVYTLNKVGDTEDFEIRFMLWDEEVWKDISLYISGRTLFY